MNILEAYIKKYSQIIIVILGLPCTNKSDIAKELALDLKLNIVNINDYLIPNKYKEIQIEKPTIQFKIYEDSENYDWDKLNKYINEVKSQGIVLYGNYLDITKINFKIDFSFFYSMNNNLCKKILIENKLLQFKESDENLNVYFKNIFNPFYDNLKTSIKFNKFYNIKEDTTFDSSYDIVFDLLMELILSKLK